MAYRLRLVGLALAALLAASAAAQPALPEFCVANPVENEGSQYYQARAEGAYCDGIVFERQSRSGLLPILSVATGAEGEAPPERAVSVVTPQPVAGPIRIQGLALDAQNNYRLDAELTAGTQLRLGPESGLAQDATMSFDTVGWLAWIDSPRGILYLPTVDHRLGTAEISITVRPGIHVNFVLYSAREATGAELIALREAARDVRANVNVTFTVPARGPSPIVVEVLAIGKAGGTELANLAIGRRGDGNGG